MQKAVELFSELGFDNTPIRELCQRAGVNVAMINYYFGSKEKLFEAIIEHKSHYMRELLKDLQADSTLDEMAKIDTIIELYVTRIWSNPLFHRIIHQEMLLKSRPEVNKIIEAMFIRNLQTIKSIIEDGIRKKIFRKVDPEFTVASVVGTINHFMTTPAIYNLLSDRPAEADPFQNTLLRTRLISHLKQMIHAHLLNNP